MIYKLRRHGIRGQRGAVLIVSLIFMLILTIIAAASMQSSTLQERMAGNAKDTNLAFQAAEAGLRAAETALSQINVGPFDGTNGLYRYCADPTSTATACVEPDWSDHSSSVGWQIMAADVIPYAAKPPEYFIQELTSNSGVNDALDSDLAVTTKVFYRVTARGYGASDRSMVVLSTTFKRNN
ncbi:pilus assembly PilX family protein [Zhongshania sp. BJYM1]|uniref:pilus assembly PilX family protein n=1 Tax=Zhongshania aquatica TaxID=2965069 RepID=UPI0022B490AC|nr:PilX N-terminal domain-containing pilus assembly protein [Marortus sp. BJYM1]